MSSIPLPALQTVQPPSPLDEFARAAQLRNTIQAGQQQQIQLQEGQMELNDQKTLRSLAPQFATRDADGKVTGFDNEGYYAAAQANNVNPQTIAKMRMTQAQMVESIAKSNTAQLDYHEKVNDQAYQLAEGMRDVASKPGADPQQVQQAYQGTLMKIKQLGVDTSNLPAQFPGVAALDEFEAHIGAHKQMLADAKERAQTGQATQAAAKDKAEGLLKQQEAEMIQNYRQNPDLFMKQIDTIAPVGTALNTRTRVSVQQALQAGDVNGAKEAIKAAGQEVGALEKEKYVQGQEDIRQAHNRQAMFSNELQKNGLNQLDKMFTDPQHGYSQFLAQSNATKSALNAAKDGNEFAASMAPLMTVLGLNSFAGIHRVSPQEIAAAGPRVGSYYRQINALLDKAGEGKIPEDTRKEMTGLIDGLIKVKHDSLVPSAQMVAQNAGLDPKVTNVMDKDGSMTTLDKLVGGEQATWFGKFGGSKKKQTP